MNRLPITIVALILMAAPANAAKASWYHEGRLTANGERYRPDGLTCAHRSLPFGTRVRVTASRSGRSVVCRINDRGPAKWTMRDIDMSRGCARVLGMIERGVIDVQIEVL